MHNYCIDLMVSNKKISCLLQMQWKRQKRKKTNLKLMKRWKQTMLRDETDNDMHG